MLKVGGLERSSKSKALAACHFDLCGADELRGYATNGQRICRLD
jgi:hypothetical protein